MLVVMISLLHSQFYTLLNHVYSLDYFNYSNWYICAMLAIPQTFLEMILLFKYTVISLDFNQVISTRVDSSKEVH